jgi:hypothetical protein
VAGAAGAQTLRKVGPGGLAGITGDLLDPTGAFGQHVSVSGGVGLNGLFIPNRDLPFALRLDGSILWYGVEDLGTFAYIPLIGAVPVTVTTSSMIYTAGVGPQFRMPYGPIRPYAFGTIGFSYFSTSSHASFDGDDWDAEDGGDAISVEQIGDMVLAFRAGGGVLIPVRGGRSPILLDLGAFYTWNDVTTYATPDRVVDVGGAVVILPVRGATNSVTFRLGLAWIF